MRGINVIPILQTAIGPVILISGIGLLLLTLTNRLARAIDRARELASEPEREGTLVKGQISILWLRSRLLRLSILLAIVGALCTGLLVIFLFLTPLIPFDFGGVVSALFIAGMLSLIGSLFLFMRDVNQSLEALRLELKERGVPGLSK